jgi:hypothetical protein
MFGMFYLVKYFIIYGFHFLKKGSRRRDDGFLTMYVLFTSQTTLIIYLRFRSSAKAPRPSNAIVAGSGMVTPLA